MTRPAGDGLTRRRACAPVTRRVRSAARRATGASGQSLVEFALTLPLLILVVLGVVELAYAMIDQHVVTRLAREGSNLISRDASLEEAAGAMRHIASAPVDFDDGSKLIFSVIKRGATTGSANYDRLFLYQRYECGTLPDGSALVTAGSTTFSGPPDYQAPNSDNDAGLQIANLPADLVPARGAMIYVTEIYTRHTRITPLEAFGISVPTTLYSVAYF
jgi:hypothetical protein